MAETLVVPYNRVPELDERVAAVIVEPVAANMGVVAPEPGFLDGLRAECDRVGALLIFDEVITGFRLDRGGAQAKYDVTPDLTTFGKVIGGGLPIGAVGGRRDVMETLSPLGPVFHAGTLSGNPLATAAGLAALDLLVPDVYMELAARARHLAAVLHEACASAGFVARFPVVGPLLGIVCGDVPPAIDFDGAKRTDEAAYAAFFQAMLAEGVALAPGAYEAIFVGLAHDDAVIDEIAAAPPERSSGSDDAADRSAILRPTRNQGGRSVTSRSVRQVLHGGSSPPSPPSAGWPRRSTCCSSTTTRSPRSSTSLTMPPTGSTWSRSCTARARDGLRHVAGGFSEGEMTMTIVPIGLDAIDVPIHPGTPGEVTCPDLDKPCVLLAETLGDSVVWFALVPSGANFRFELPAIESLDGGYAHLVNGWEVRYADVIDRSRCEDGEATDVAAESFSEFLRLAGENHRSLYDLGRGELIAVSVLSQPVAKRRRPAGTAA